MYIKNLYDLATGAFKILKSLRSRDHTNLGISGKKRDIVWIWSKTDLVARTVKFCACCFNWILELENYSPIILSGE